MSSLALDGTTPRSRAADPITSVDAGRAVNLAASQSMVLELLEDYGEATDQQLEDGLKDYYSPSRVRSARSELTEAGIVVRADRVVQSIRTTRRKRDVQVWRVASPTD